MKSKKGLRLLALILAAILVLAGCSSSNDTTAQAGSADGSETSASSSQSDTKEPATDASNAEVSLKDDFYQAVNADWLNSNEIPATDMAIGGFTELADDIEELLMADFKKMLDGDVQTPNAELGEFLKFYEMAADYETRNELGAEPVKPYMEQIEALTSLEDLDEQLVEWCFKGNASPVFLSTMADMGNASTYGLYATAPGLILPDKSYYDTQVGTQLLTYYSQTAQQMLTLYGYSEQEAQTIAEQALEFDALLVPTAKTAEENSEFTALYNPVSMEEFSGYSSSLDLSSLVSGLTGTAPKEVILTNPAYYQAFDEIVNDENFEMMKSWMLVNTIYSYAGYLSDDFREATFSYSMLLTGQTEMEDPQTDAYTLSSSIYSMVVGNYYGETYFGEDAKADVIGMVDKMIDVYVSRLQNNDWLGDETIQAAITKLETMQIQIGYPDTLDPLYSQFIVTDYEAGGDIISNVSKFTEMSMKENLAQYGTEVDRSEWGLSANTVNATYSPMSNTITFPAAILQEPFYSLNQSESANYGGIGAVIAHEITHAFDNNGAQFDELGNLKNWWTEEDYTAFESKTAEMVELFDGREFGSGTVNGNLTVSENIADAGGLSCAMEIVQSLPDGDLEEFFTSWAVIWRMKATSQYEELLLMADVHAPSKLRANVQLSNLQEFQDLFDIKEGDGMYLPAEQMVKIW